MPKIRIGLSTDFNLVGEQVGIGTTNPTARLDVAGQILAGNTAGSGGISTFREYQGFSQVQAKITNNTLIDNGDCGPFSSLSGEIRITSETTVSSGSTVEVGKTKTLTVTDRFAVPLGDTNTRDNTPEAGTTRFNVDFGTLEFFDGNTWKTVNSYARHHDGGAGRVVIIGGNLVGSPNAPTTRRMDYLNLSTLGNSMYFGDIASPLGSRRQTGGCSSSTRGIFMGGQGTGANLNEIGYLTIASQGNAIDFGNLLAARQTCQTLSSSTRGISYASGEPAVNVIEYVEIATTGDSVDFGDSAKLRRDGFALASSTRGISGGGTGGTNADSLMEYITIASKGDGTEFGNLSQAGRGIRAFSNSTRGIIGGGYGLASPYARFSAIQSITISSTGNAVYFGDLTDNIAAMSSGSSSNETRGVFAGGSNPSNINNIEYVNISSSGNSQDFGELSAEGWNQVGSCSDSHGGLGGF